MTVVVNKTVLGAAGGSRSAHLIGQRIANAKNIAVYLPVLTGLWPLCIHRRMCNLQKAEDVALNTLYLLFSRNCLCSIPNCIKIVLFTPFSKSGAKRSNNAGHYCIFNIKGNINCTLKIRNNTSLNGLVALSQPVVGQRGSKQISNHTWLPCCLLLNHCISTIEPSHFHY